ncbi:uncharacterized oxidoreductase [[Candida] railenensis]|uniref:Uncharacterized oxidoreductase n=1 Tax=[Candida] railenensis TaxID=45579 RepID=A0A9P0QNW8_9ASCO|nr:uncharacterized oxidoreductase [[Candida] railenensis]
MTATYFITGANGQIGYAVVEELSKRSDVKIIATVRSIEKAEKLISLKKKTGNVEIVTLDVASEESVDALDEQLKKVAPDGIDVYIANAGIFNPLFTVKDAPRHIWLDHYKANVLGPILTYQVLYPYLLKKDTRKIIFISSRNSSISQYFPFSVSAYGQSKAALNYTGKELSSELEAENFTVISLSPGVVLNEKAAGLIVHLPAEVQEAFKKEQNSPQDCAIKQLKVIDGLTKESNGKFFNYDGSEIPW